MSIHLQDQLLANISGKIQIDIWHGLQIFVEKPSEKETIFDWIDVTKADQISDD